MLSALSVLTLPFSAPSLAPRSAASGIRGLAPGTSPSTHLISVVNRIHTQTVVKPEKPAKQQRVSYETILLLFLIASAASAQTPTFDAASIKLNQYPHLLRWSACAVKRRLVHSGCESRPGTGSFRPVAIGAVVEVTKLLKPPVEEGRKGDSASVQAVT